MSTEPNQKDHEVTVAAYWEVEHGEKSKAVAAYRAEIESEKDIEITHARMATASAIEQRDANQVRIATLLDALDKAEKALKRIKNYPVHQPKTAVPRTF